MALELFEAQPERERCAEFVAAAQIDGAVANIALDEVDAAVDQLQSVLSLPTENRTLPVAQRMQKLGLSLLSPRFAASGVVADLRERVELFGAYTAACELPAG